MSGIKKKKMISLLPFSLCIVIMVIIYVFSSQNGSISSQLSIKVSRLFARIIYFDFGDFPPELQRTITEGLHGFVRKAAHFTVFSFLGFCIFMSLKLIISSYGISFILSAMVCFLYAGFDEFRQLHITGRAGQFSDVLLDTAGSVSGIIISVFFIAAFNYFISVRNKRNDKGAAV